jgi:hypothetical protein
MEAIASKISSFVAAILSSPCWKYALHTKSTKGNRYAVSFLSKPTGSAASDFINK